jgi:Putative zincin peptidase
METSPILIAVPWKPTPTTHLWMTILSTVVALVAGCVAFVIAFGGKDGMITFDPVGLLVALGLIIVSVVAHEGVHGLAIIAYRGRPTFGSGMAGKLLPYFYCTAPGQRFSIAQYAVVALAPTVVINVALVGGLLSSVPGWFVLPFAVHMAGCIGDWFLVVLAWRAPRGSLVEDMKDGLIIHKPAT